jgi:CRP/FNR family transcriptional regulator, cyclic AMP receptor protein
MKKILLIEDNDDIRENTAEILELANYKVITAPNGKIGVALALKHKPDIIICDIMMPELDGYGVLHSVHKNETIKNTPFIFLTAKTERNDLRKGMDLGADDYITKPFSGTELLNAIDGRLKKLDVLKQSFSSDLNGLGKLFESTTSQLTLNSLTDGANTNVYKKKQIIYSEDNHPNRLYYVLKGKVKTFKSNDIGKDLITELYTAGDFLGHIALLEGTAYKDTAEALEDTELAVIPKEDFETLINNNSEVARKFIQLLAKNVSEKEDQLIGMAYNSLRKKVAEAILLLQKKYHEDKSKPFVIDISREGLATLAGTATESLIRTLSDFKSEKLIELKDGHIIMHNQTKLEHLLN